MISIWHRASRAPWAITEDALQNILEVASRQNLSPEAVAAKLGRELKNTYQVEMREGNAIIPMTGPLFRYANMFTAISGATSYEMMARDFTAAIEDPEVSRIILNIDSPGGEANGANEFAEMIYQARGIKPIIAYVGGMGASAAYWAASAADEIVADETALLGSIGVRTVLEDRTAQDEQNGIKQYNIVSSISPNKDIDPKNEADLARVKAIVDALATIFVAKVARNRSTTPEDVAVGFGAGDVLLGRAAVAAGMADRLGSFEGLLNEQNTTSTQGTSYMTTRNNTDQLGADAAGDQHTDTQPPASTGQTKTYTETEIAAVRNEGIAAGALAERDRIKTILDCEAAIGRERQAIALATRSGMAPDAASAILEASPKAAGGNPFADAMANQDSPDIAADADWEGETDCEQAVIQRILKA